jgi:hypothetical protein
MAARLTTATVVAKLQRRATFLSYCSALNSSFSKPCNGDEKLCGTRDVLPHPRSVDPRQL